MKKVAHPNEIQNTKVINSVYNYHSICMCYLRKSFIRTMDITNKNGFRYESFAN